MHVSTLLYGAASLLPFAQAIYQVQDDYSGNNFFDMFRFDTVRFPLPPPACISPPCSPTPPNSPFHFRLSVEYSP